MTDDGMMSTAELEAEMQALEASLMAGLTEDLSVNEQSTNDDRAMRETPETRRSSPQKDGGHVDHLYADDVLPAQQAEVGNLAEVTTEAVTAGEQISSAAIEANGEGVSTFDDTIGAPTGPRRRRGKKVNAGWDSDYEPDNEGNQALSAKITGKGSTARKTRLKAATGVAGLKRTSVARDSPSAVVRRRKSTVSIPAGRVRRPPTNGIIDSRPLGRTLEECDPADQMLFTKASAAVPWPEIHATWKEMTGTEPAASTLPNRFKRLRENFSTINEEDRPFLLDAKEEVEREWQAMKWAKIAERVKEKGGEGYQADVLQRPWKKLMVAEGLRPPPGLIDPDWQIEVKKGGESDGGNGEAA
ncbi:hypothetical protein B0A48_07808 [Cryoendolithus antarcticus]|uniref:Myb-like domain-containing protein n=1 Tax=Cryoendolithus antarcticus TaxID=1507870 RepID=A0A1V8T7N3_9PEZI|nr:hypothetical protein B0A48_07808 [Cryoendolithus antarcticus]